MSDALGTDFIGLESPRIVRPDLFITPQVIGLAVPLATAGEGRLAGKWKLHLLFTESGKRQIDDPGNGLTLPDGTRVWFHPLPSGPSPTDSASWTPTGRRRWLSGETPDVAGVFIRVRDAITDYIDLPPEHAEGTINTLALWAMLTYVFPAWPAVPYLYVTGPLGSGKTRVFEVLQQSVYRPLSTSNMSASSLFRRLHDRGGTLLLDEAERLKEGTPDASELRSILLAGYKRGGKAIRNEKSGDASFQQIEYEVFGPKALAAINGLPPALASRCIPVTMFRASPGSPKPKRRIDAEANRWADLRDDLHSLAVGPLGMAAPELSQSEGVCTLSNRNYELWQPLMAIADFVERQSQGTLAGLLASVQAHAAKTLEDSEEAHIPDVDQILVSILAERIRNGGQAPTTKEVLEEAQHREPELFKRWTTTGVSEHLRRYGLKTKKIDGRREYRDVTISQLTKIQAAYNMDLALEPQSKAGTDGVTPNKTSVTGQQVSQVSRVSPGARETSAAGAPPPLKSRPRKERLFPDIDPPDARADSPFANLDQDARRN